GRCLGSSCRGIRLLFVVTRFGGSLAAQRPASDPVLARDQNSGTTRQGLVQDRRLAGDKAADRRRPRLAASAGTAPAPAIGTNDGVRTLSQDKAKEGVGSGQVKGEQLQ